MSKPIRRVAVLGAGVMGNGIAAHVANAGLPVLLLDIVPRGADENASRTERNSVAAGALKKALKAKPAPFFHKKHTALIEVGNLEDDLGRVNECDIVIEAIIERLDIKRSLFAKLDALLDDQTIVASNTSGLRIRDMLEGRSDKFRKNFLVTHFFNPPRYMKLLELVAGPDTDPEIMQRASDFGTDVLGKGIVIAKDAPNFVANRIGMHAFMVGIHTMLDKGLSPEDVDALTGPPMAHPKSATFRTADMVGLDTLIHVVDNCFNSLTEDEDRAVFAAPTYMRAMLERGQLGRKAKAGFYKKTKEGIETLDPGTGEYRPKAGNPDIKKACKALGKESDIRKRVRKMVASEGVIGEFAWTVLSRSFAYCARRLGEICDDVVAIDNGMKWGYGWELGPFESWDALGFQDTVKRMREDGIDLPESIIKMADSGIENFYTGDRVYNPLLGDYVTQKADPREVTLQVMRRGEAPVLKNKGAEAWDLGDGILGVTFKTKANSIDPDSIQMLHDAVERAERDFRGMLLFNQGEHFCVGANLFLVAMAGQQKRWEDIRTLVKSYQAATQRTKYATIPVVAAPYSMTLGGGLELCFGCDAVQGAAETYSGLVEVGVGLIPGGAGTMNMMWRALESIPDGIEYDMHSVVTQVFKNIAMADVATSFGMGQEKGYFRMTDGVSFDRSRQLHEAKQRLIGLSNAGYHPPVPRTHKLAGKSGIATLQMMAQTLVSGGYASEHDAKIAGKLAVVLCGGVSGHSHQVTEAEVLELECEAFVSLCGEPKTQERMQHMLMKNKPLRN